MSAFLRQIHFPWIISIGSALLGVIILALCLPHEGELRTEGVGFSLGYLGFLSTLLAGIPLRAMPMSWDPHDFAPPIAVAFFYFAQWQFIAWLLHRWLYRPVTATPNA